MTERHLPPNVYRVAQRDFDAIPGSPWVYWIPDSLRALFETLPKLGDVAQPRQGLATADNARFLRYWWEVGPGHIAFGCQNQAEAQASGKRWFPYMKGGGYCKWYGNLYNVVNWENNGIEIQNFYTPNGRLASRPQNTDYYLKEGITYSYLTSATFSARISPGGAIFDVAGSSLFPHNIPLVLSIMNSTYASYALKLINPTVNFQVGDLSRLPLAHNASKLLELLTQKVIVQAKIDSAQDESTYDFIAPTNWESGPEDKAAAAARLAELEAQIDEEVYRLYGISDEDRAAIEAELAGAPLSDEEDEAPSRAADEDEVEDDEAESGAEQRQELAVRWIAYAVGIVLGRFTPGTPGALGSAIYRRTDFAIGSLPAPDAAEFDRLVGPVARFAYVDESGGRHLFPAAVEAALRDLAIPDGISVLDAGHPRDLPARVERALALMLDTPGATGGAAQGPSAEVIALGAGGELRKFLERDFFTQYHLKWYRKRPVYWPLQSAKRSYGFVLFHEKIDKQTLYTLLREYVDYKRNGLAQQIADLADQQEGLEGHARKQVARQRDDLAQRLAEIDTFAETIERIAKAGYQPEPDWIDDGVILRMAPLWELVPIWRAEPKKYWERLQKGRYDWSHIAMHYWPERVRQACRANKSFAIAHGHPEWYAGA